MFDIKSEISISKVCHGQKEECNIRKCGRFVSTAILKIGENSAPIDVDIAVNAASGSRYGFRNRCFYENLSYF